MHHVPRPIPSPTCLIAIDLDTREQTQLCV